MSTQVSSFMENDYLDDAIAASFVDELTNELGELPSADRQEYEPVDVEAIHKKITSEFSEVITHGLETLAELKARAVSGSDPDAIEAFSTVMGATTTAIGEMNRINLQALKIAGSKELEDQKHSNKRNQMELKSELDIKTNGQSQLSGNTNNILIATREDVIREWIKPMESKVADSIRANLDRPAAPTIEVSAEVIEAERVNKDLADNPVEGD